MQSAAGASSVSMWTLTRLIDLDPDAWEALYHEARPALWRFARARLATDDQAEDAVSEVMVRAMSAIGRFREGRPGITGWMFGIARNVVNEMYRSGARQRNVSAHIDSAHVEPTHAEPTDALVADEEARAIRAAFADLPVEDRELLHLRVVARLDAATTAKVLGKRAGAIRMQQSRALGRLRVNLAGRER